MQKEIEVKFKINPEDNIRKKLSKLGGIAKNPYQQKSYGFFSDNSVEKGIFPRIREENGKIVLTVKVKDLQNKNEDYFERKEYSISISNLDEGIEILKLLGFNEIRSFEKEREEWHFSNLFVTIDKLYFGTFMEIEGQSEEIEKMIINLGLENRPRIIKAYLALEDEYNEK